MLGTPVLFELVVVGMIVRVTSRQRRAAALVLSRERITHGATGGQRACFHRSLLLLLLPVPVGVVKGFGEEIGKAASAFARLTQENVTFEFVVAWRTGDPGEDTAMQRFSDAVRDVFDRVRPDVLVRAIGDLFVDGQAERVDGDGTAIVTRAFLRASPHGTYGFLGHRERLVCRQGEDAHTRYSPQQRRGHARTTNELYPGT